MIVENKVPAQEDIVKPLLPLDYIADGEEFHQMASAMSTIRQNKNDPMVIKDALNDITKSLRACFGIEVTFVVVDGTDSIEFYGFNVYPNIEVTNKILTLLMRNNTEEISAIWQKNRKWHIDIDGKIFFDYSNHLTAQEIATLFLYTLEQVIFDYHTPLKIGYIIIKYRIKMNYMASMLADNEKLRVIFLIPFLIGCAETNFIMADKKKRTELEINSIVATNPNSYERYNSAVKKLFSRYGLNGLIDRRDAEMDAEINAILNWIYEGLNDLRFSSLRVAENVKRHMVACRSPYVRLVFRNILLRLADVKSGMGGNQQVEESMMNPQMKEMQRRIQDQYWTNFVTTMETSFLSTDYIDRDGNIKKIERKDLDLIMVECENIESVNDKIYLMERLYKVIGHIQAALDALSDSKTARKVKQSKNELENLKQYAEDIRRSIVTHRMTPERYGLFVKYPAGYEG